MKIPAITGELNLTAASTVLDCVGQDLCGRQDQVVDQIGRHAGPRQAGGDHSPECSQGGEVKA